VARLRKLAPDAALFRRRAAGEPLRSLAADYGLAHTTLSRFFARPEARRALREAEQLNETQARAAQARWQAQQRAARQARATRTPVQPAAAARPQSQPPLSTPATVDAARERPAARAARPARRAGGRSERFSYADWLDERDARAAPAPDRVELHDKHGRAVVRTFASRVAAKIALHEPVYGPLTVVYPQKPPRAKRPRRR
jgi:hypothetical protein